jgi:5S rRNA maturation endonuclease (ribonuclease M5)
MTNKIVTNKPYFSQALLTQISNECCNNIETMLNALGVEYYKGHKRLYGPCPIHGGDNPMAWNIYPDGDVVRGTWFCYTHRCQKKWKKNIIGFVHGVLSNKTANMPWTQAVLWMIKFLGYKDVHDIKIDDALKLDRQNYSNIFHRLNINCVAPQPKTTWTPTIYKSQVVIPSKYYIKRGYSQEILQKYDVGDSQRSYSSVIPIYDNKHQNIIGMIGRTHYNKCNACGFYHGHDDKCPTTAADQITHSKWRNAPGFDMRYYLYNLWFAKEHIEKTQTIILTEGPGDVWRLEEADIHNSVAIFKACLTEEQLVILEGLQCTNVILLLDNDDAGQNGTQEITKMLHRTHNIYCPKLSAGSDVGDLTVEEIKHIIGRIYT